MDKIVNGHNSLQGFIDSGRYQLSEAVYEYLRHQITLGELGPGYQLPASRRLAEELGISRTTIVSAYEQLIAEGFAYTKQGAGTFVGALGEIELPNTDTPIAATQSRPSARREPTQPFKPGEPDMRLFAYEGWAKALGRAARKAPKALVRTEEIFGDELLRSQICRYLQNWRGIHAEPYQVIITAGATEALELCIRTLLSAKKPVFLEDPGYPPLVNFVHAMGYVSQPLQMDADGSTPPLEATSGALAVLTPSSQFPLGGTLPHARRMQFVHWASEHSGWIIEDDYDSEFRYAGRPVQALAGLDQHGRTLYVGSFSKVFSDGTRLGFLLVPTTLVAGFEATLERVGGKASSLPQRPLGLFMESGDYDRHIRKLRRTYRERREALIRLVDQHLSPWVSFEDHKAGMHLTLKLDLQLSDAAVVEHAKQHGVHCRALSSYYQSVAKQNGLLLGFCGYTSEEMEAAMPILAQSIRQLIQP